MVKICYTESMKLWHSVWGILALLLAGCTAATFSPTPTWPAGVYDTAVAYHATVITEAIQNSKMNYAFVPLVSNAGCDSYNAAIELIPDKVSLAVDDTLKVTVLLQNTGCSSLGMPTYQIQPRKIEALAYQSPEVQTHSQALGPGEKDAAEFLFTAKMHGQVELAAQADFEINLDTSPSSSGGPTPAMMRRQVISSPVTVTIK